MNITKTTNTINSAEACERTSTQTETKTRNETQTRVDKKVLEKQVEDALVSIEYENEASFEIEIPYEVKNTTKASAVYDKNISNQKN